MKLQRLFKKKTVLFFQTKVQSSLDPGKTDSLKDLILFLVWLNGAFNTQTMAACYLPDGVGFWDWFSPNSFQSIGKRQEWQTNTHTCSQQAA